MNTTLGPTHRTHRQYVQGNKRVTFAFILCIGLFKSGTFIVLRGMYLFVVLIYWGIKLTIHIFVTTNLSTTT